MAEAERAQRGARLPRLRPRRRLDRRHRPLARAQMAGDGRPARRRVEPKAACGRGHAGRRVATPRTTAIGAPPRQALAAPALHLLALGDKKLMKIAHKLLVDGDAVTLAATANQSPGICPLYLVMHYTAGLGLDGTIAWLRNPAVKASAHLVIGRPGHGQGIACQAR